MKTYPAQPWTIQDPYPFVGPAGIDSGISKRIPMSIRWSLLLFAFSLPYEATDIGIFSGSLSLPRIGGLLVMMSCLLHPRVTFSLPHPVFLCFGAYLIVHFVHGVLVNTPWYSGDFLVFFLTRVQVVLFAWLISKPLKDRRLAVQSLVAFSAGCIFLVLGMLLGLPGFAEARDYNGVERVTALGTNPNFLGALLALATVTSIGLFLGKGLISPRTKFLLVCFSLLLPVGVLLTASRTAIICTVIGLAIYLLPVGRIRAVINKAPYVVLLLVVLGVMIARSPEALTRLGKTFYEGNSSGRDKILESAVPLIVQKPFFGWGPIEWQRQLGIDAHNHYVYLLLEGGIIGSFPYILGLLLCLRSIWKSVDSDWGKVCFAVFSTLMLANLSGNFPSFKIMWLMIAVCVSLSARSAQKLGGLRGSAHFAVKPRLY